MKPLLYPSAKDSFDASSAHSVYFAWNDSEYIKNRIRIWDADTSALIYDNIQAGRKPYHAIAGGALTNGKTYKMTVAVIDNSGTESAESEPVTFSCYTAPVMKLSISEGDMISPPARHVTVSYTQPEGESLQEFMIELYNSLEHKIRTSKVLYDRSSAIALTGLKSGRSYKIRAVGITAHGMSTASELISFTAA